MNCTIRPTHKEVFGMNSLTAEKRYQFAKWAEIIKSCKSSGMQISEWLKQNNSKCSIAST